MTKTCIMFALILQFIFVLSLGGLALMTLRKIPAMLALPETTQAGPNNGGVLNRLKGLSFEPKVKFSLSKEKMPKIKTADASLLAKLDKKDEIDNDGDYWAKIAEK